MSNKFKVCVLGSGAFGTAMAHCAKSNFHIKEVMIYSRNPEVAESINSNHRNPKFFSEFELNPQITATTDLEQALQKSKYILSCIPVQQMTSFIKENKKYFDPHIPFVSCSKGIIVETGKTISQMLKEEFDNSLRYACLSGPSFAKELLQNFPSCVVVASEDNKTSKLIQLGLSSSFLRIYTQHDVIGVELAGALKNIIAIGSGVIEGAGFGYNSQTAFITRCVGEMQRYSRYHGAVKHTFYGLSGIGDLMLTSFGSLSRNRSFGMKIGQGQKMEDILKESKGVVEGLPTLEIVYKDSLAHNIDMPSTRTLHDFIKGKLSKEECLQQLMLRTMTDEFEPTFEDLVQ